MSDPAKLVRIPPGSSFDVEFSDPADARRVHELMRGGLTFQQSVDRLELRPLTHFSVTCTDVGLDGMTENAK